MRDPQPVRDWSTLRNRAWKPTPQPEEGGGGSSSSGASGSRGSGRGAGQASKKGTAPAVAATSAESSSAPGASVSSSADASEAPVRANAALQTDTGASSAGYPDRELSRWCTDSEISASRSGAGQNRSLVRWEACESSAALEGTLEELAGPPPHRKRQEWDQFEVNRRLFGVESTFKDDLSQYTTPLNTKVIPAEVKQKAKMIAQSIENNGRGGARHTDMDVGAEYEEEVDEEDLFSAVPRSGGYNDYADGDANASAPALGGGEDGGIGGALLASLRAGSAAAKAEGSGRPGCDHRSLIAPKVQNWWRARRLSGASIPPGAEDALVCPFSQRVFGDVSQLVTHWAAALPRGAGQEGETPCEAATERFRLAGAQLSWAELTAETGLDNTLSLESPKTGSVWAQLVAKLETRGRAAASENGDRVRIADRRVADFVNEAVLMKCWRRDQKVEHREVLESLAASLALHILDGASSF